MMTIWKRVCLDHKIFWIVVLVGLVVEMTACGAVVSGHGGGFFFYVICLFHAIVPPIGFQVSVITSIS